MAIPTKGMKEEAQRGLDWRKEFGRGGTRIGVTRANQIVNGDNLSDDTIKRMYSFFSRHEVDKQGEGFSQGEDGYPSNGRIAWALWGGDAGFAWSKRLVEQMEDDRALERAEPDALQVGDFVSWNSAGGRARGKIIKIERDGTINIPNSDFTVTGTEEDPAALIQVYRSGEPTDTEVGHKFSTLTKINPIRQEDINMEKEDRHIINVTETDESVVVEFAKEHEDEEDQIEESSYNDEEEERKVVEMPMKYRSIDLSRASYIDEDERRVRIGVSSEEPVERSFGLEVLSHKAEDINVEFINSGRAPLLLDHNMNQQIGVIEEFALDEKQSRTVAIVRFGKSALAQEVFQDVVDGIRMNISVGYKVDRLDRSKDGDKVVYRAAWTPLEISSVSLPADQSRLVGVGRSEDKNKINHKIEVKQMSDNVNLDDVKAQSAEEVKAELKRNSKEIYELASRHGKTDLASKCIAEHMTIEEFRGVLLDEVANDKPLETPKELGMSPKEVRQFSLLRGINALANPSDRAAQKAAEFEFECSAEAAKLYGRNSQGLMLPPEVLRSWNQRDLNTTDDAGLVGEDFRGGDFVDALRNASSVMSAGATMLRGLSGDVKIPKKTAASTAAFVSSEGTAVAESEMTIGSITMSPKTLGCFTDVTRQLLVQSSLDVENLIRNDIAQSMALAIDLGALEGSGTSGNPTGIKNTSGINTVTFAAANPTWAETVNMESQVAVDNALLGNLSYILRADDYGSLKTTEKATGTAQFIVDRDGRINNYGVVVSNQPTSGDHYFGNFSDLLIGMFGGVELIVDPYTNSSSGTVRVVGIQMIDVAVRNAVSFCLGNDGV